MNFQPNEYIIELNNEGIYINPERLISYADTNLPKHAFGFKKSVFWKVKAGKYDTSTRSIQLDVVNYNELYHVAFEFQEFEQPVKLLLFEKLDWHLFEPLLYTHTLKYLKPFLKNIDRQIASHIYSRPKQEISENVSNEPAIETDPEPKWYPFSQDLQVLFADAVFSDGFVAFNAFIGKRCIEVRIANDFIKEEFDYIKGWFSKKFAKDFFTVTISGEHDGDQVRLVCASSQEITLIDENFIETLRPIYIAETFISDHAKGYQKVSKVKDILKDDGLGQLLFGDDPDPQQVLQQILSLNKVRNQRELQFLSEHKRVDLSKVRHSTSPQNGFIFSYRTESMQILIWELLDSHATYVWLFSIADSEDYISSVLNNDIGIIEQNGRQHYRRARKEEEKPYKFKPVHHHPNNPTIDIWKREIESLIELGGK